MLYFRLATVESRNTVDSEQMSSIKVFEAYITETGVLKGTDGHGLILTIQGPFKRREQKHGSLEVQTSKGICQLMDLEASAFLFPRTKTWFRSLPLVQTDVPVAVPVAVSALVAVSTVPVAPAVAVSAPVAVSVAAPVAVSAAVPIVVSVAVPAVPDVPVVAVCT
jgi:hypothetical protein